MPGIQNVIGRSSNLVITSSATLVTSGLSFSIAAGQFVRGVFILPFSVGATGGIRAQILAPAAPSFFNSYLEQPAVTTGIVAGTTTTASTVYTNALAVAADYTMKIFFSIINGTTAGTVDLQVAQNTSDALSLTIKAGANVEWAVVAN